MLKRKDLEYDALHFKSSIVNFEDKLPFFDSVFHFLNAPAAFNNKLPFKFWGRTDVHGAYIPAEPTIQQLKNSGNLRLLENKKLLDSVLVYDSHIQGVYLNQTNYVLEFHKHLIQVKEKVYDMSKFSNYLDDFNQDKVNEYADYSFSLFSKDRLAINELFSNYIELKAAIVFHISNLKGITKEAEYLLALIKKEYHMK